MYPRELEGMSDREVLFVLVNEVYHVSETMNKFFTEQKGYNRETDDRIHIIEMEGARPNTETSDRLDKMETRLGTLEKSACCETAVASWWNSQITRWAMLTGVCVALLGLILNIAGVI